MPGSEVSADIGCGVAMPPLQYGAPLGYTQAHKDCLMQFFRGLAALGMPCPSSTGR